jgi:hypothetical protein
MNCTVSSEDPEPPRDPETDAETRIGESSVDAEPDKYVVTALAIT